MPEQKDILLREALVISCDVLSSIDLDALQRRIERVLGEADQTTPGWKDKIIGDSDHFNYFLQNVESKILDGAGLDDRVRERILRDLRVARKLCLSRVKSVDAKETIMALFHLKHDICKLKEEKKKEAIKEQSEKERQEQHTKLVRTLLVAVIVFDSYRFMLYPAASIAACAASIALASAASRFL